MTATSLHIPQVPMTATSPERRRGLGSLEALGPARSALPLAGVKIRARVADRVAEVTVEQRYSNPLSDAVEAVYIFPLAGGAAVSRFELQVGTRIVRGKVCERGQARQDYAAALEQGKRAALLEQERDDVFTLQVGNLPPGEEVTVRLTYSERLPFFEDGQTELRLPLVVAPRYVGGQPLDREQVGDGVTEDSTTVPDASRITPPRLVKGFDPKVALGIEVELFGGFDDLACSQHATRVSAGPEAIRVALARDDELLDRDFVLRWRLAKAGAVSSTLLVHGGYGMLSLVPPARQGFLGVARDVVFVVDRSGSMEGPKIASAARACALLLRTLAPRDRFAIQAFNDGAEWMPGDEGAFVAADEGGTERGERYLRSIESRGGTEFDAALREAFAAMSKLPRVSGRVRVVVLLTDGQVGDESSVLRRVQNELGDARIFTVGIDTAVNTGFLNRLAAMGGGTSTFVEPGAQLEGALQAVGREIGTPLVTDLRIEGIDESSLSPARLPDLFAGRGSAVFFRAVDIRAVKVVGKLEGGKKFEQEIQAREAPLAALGHLWARSRVIDLEDRFRAAPSAEVQKEIVALAVQHALLTRFTAFLAVDESGATTHDGTRRKIVQPVEMPAQWAHPAQDPDEYDLGIHLPRLRAMAGTPLAIPRPPSRPLTSPVSASMKKMAHSLFSGARGHAPAAPPPPSLDEDSRGMSEQRAESSTGMSARERGPLADRVRIEAALQDLISVVASARVELAAGRLPQPEPLERARAALLNSLAASSLGVELPLLQKFLRSAAVELVAALGSATATAASLVPVFDRHAAALVEARDQARIPLGAATRAAPGSFWEATI